MYKTFLHAVEMLMVLLNIQQELLATSSTMQNRVVHLTHYGSTALKVGKHSLLQKS